MNRVTAPEPLQGDLDNIRLSQHAKGEGKGRILL